MNPVRLNRLSYLAVVGLAALTITRVWPYQDRSHYSAVFGTNRMYRIFLPAGYNGSAQSYPVVYFLHGWGGRYNNEPSANLDYAAMDSLCTARGIILVALDGMMDPSDPTPYNVGEPAYSIQYHDYFTEAVAHIDTAYRTLADRGHRALMGFSMGGFMSFFLSGKYPHLFCAAVDFVGSAEMYVGTPSSFVLYSNRYAFLNHQGIVLRFHNSTSGELHYLNQEVHQGALWEGRLSYSYREYPGGHQIDFPGESGAFAEAFDYVAAALQDPLPEPARWHHLDLYPAFTVWDYQVQSTLDRPGFINLRGVTLGGLNVLTAHWLPDGPSVPGVSVQVLTAPRYQPAAAYTLFDYNVTRGQPSSTAVTSSGDGRIGFTVNHENHQLGIYRSGDPPEPVLVGYAADPGSLFLPDGQEASLRLRVLNRGGSAGRQLTVALASEDTGLTIAGSPVSLGDIPVQGVVWSPAGFRVTARQAPPENGAPFRVRFLVTFTDQQQRTWQDELAVPIFYNVAEFPDLKIDDGCGFRGLTLGQGDGDSIPDPGETVMIYARNRHRTRLYHQDPYLDEGLYYERLPSIWGDGITTTSLITIRAQCPLGHPIPMLANYELKDPSYQRRYVRWGTVTLTVGQKWQSPVDDPAGPRPLSGTLVTAGPRPARDRVQVVVRLGQVSRVSLQVHDLAGRRVAILQQGLLPAGSHTFYWDTPSGRAGVYLVQGMVAGQPAAIRLIVL